MPLISCQDMSFPAAVIVLSNSMPADQQGLAASLVNTVVNYSISIGLGMAGTVESQQNNGGKDVLRGYRSAWYVGIGLASLGICSATLFLIHSNWALKRNNKGAINEQK